MQTFILAVDGGGTKCSAVLYSMSGKVLAHAKAGPCNLVSNFEMATNSIVSAAKQCLKQLKSTRQCDISLGDVILGAGCAGGGIEGVQQKLSNWRSPFQRAFITSDLHISCLSANNGGDCNVGILGTGSSFALFKQGKVIQIGGHGFTLGDQASGAWLGKQALMKVLEYHDRQLSSAIELPFSELNQANVDLSTVAKAESEMHFFERISDFTQCASIDALIEKYAHQPSTEFAKIAPLVFQLADAGEKIALAIIQKACDYIETIVLEHNLGDAEKIVLLGGLAERYLPYLMMMSSTTRLDLSKLYQLLPQDKSIEYGAYLFACSHLQ